MSVLTPPATSPEQQPKSTAGRVWRRRRSTSGETYPEVRFVVDIDGSSAFAECDPSARSMITKAMFAELTNATRPGDVVMRVSSSRAQVTLRSVPPTDVESARTRLEGAIRSIAVSKTATLDAHVSLVAD